MMRNKKVSFICAMPPSRNTGMVTVDLSAHMLLKKLGIEAEHITYAMASPEDFPYGKEETPLSYRSLHGEYDHVIRSDAVIYWGDFLHARSYLLKELAPRLGGYPDGRVSEENTQLIYRYHLSEGASEENMSRTLSFGGTIITNNASDYGDESYSIPLQRFFAGARSVLLRDPISAAQASVFRPGRTLGMDCAFLLDDQDLSALTGFVATPPELRSGVGVYFGRSPNVASMLAFSRAVSRGLGERAEWLPWFTAGSRRRSLARAFGYDVPAVARSPGAILRQMSRQSVIITDTYHVCVNAWRMGIPAVCIGLGTTRRGDTLGDKKKETLYALYAASEMYVFSEVIGSPFGLLSESKRIVDRVENGTAASQISKAINRHREDCLRMIGNELSEVLSA